MIKKTFLISIVLTISLILSSATGLIAKPESEEIDISGLSISEIENLFPMSAEAEAAITHTSPGVSFVVDGIGYKPEEVSLFDGQRLRFAFDTKGTLYAFTSAKGFEEFIAEEYGKSELSDEPMMGIESTPRAKFWEHMGYTGQIKSVAAGIAYYSIGSLNNKISSADVDGGMTGALLYDYEYFQGDSFFIPGGTRYYLLMQFNDLTSSIYTLI